MLVHDVADALRVLWGRSWRWLIWTPRRLLTVCVVVIGGVLIWSTTTGGGASADKADGFVADDDLPSGWHDWAQIEARPNTSGSAPGAAEPSPGPADGATASAQQDAHQPPARYVRARVTRLVDRFARAYLASDRSAAAWRRGVTPLVTPGLAKSLRSVDPANLDATVRGPADVSKIGDMGGFTTVETDQGELVVKVTNTGSTWRVSQVRPPSQRPKG